MRFLLFILSCVCGLCQNPADLMATYGVLYPTQVQGMVVWVTADTGCYKDAGSTLCADGESVQQWNDQSGNNNHYTQATAGGRPRFRTGRVNGLPGVDFGPTSVTCLSNQFAALPAPKTYFIAFFTSNNVSGGGYTIESKPDAATPLKMGVVTGKDSAIVTEGSGINIFGLQTNYTMQVLSFTGRTNRVGIRTNGLDIYLDSKRAGFGANSATNVRTGSCLGGSANAATAARYYGLVFEFLLYSRDLSDHERYGIEMYLKRKYALAHPF